MSRSTLLIAVVDDEEPIRRALHRLLRSTGLCVETYTDGYEFLQSLKDHRPDCLILDLHMPAINGFEVQLKMAESKQLVPTIVITGHDSPDSRDRALRAGASDFLRKPVDEQTLLSAIEKAVAQGTKLAPETRTNGSH